MAVERSHEYIDLFLEILLKMHIEQL